MAEVVSTDVSHMCNNSTVSVKSHTLSISSVSVLYSIASAIRYGVCHMNITQIAYSLDQTPLSNRSRTSRWAKEIVATATIQVARVYVNKPREYHLEGKPRLIKKLKDLLQDQVPTLDSKKKLLKTVSS